VSTIKDLDFHNRFSWQSVLDMLVALCAESADLSFDSRIIGDEKLPTLEMRLDRPEDLEEPASMTQGHACVEMWTRGTVVLADGDLPDKLPCGPVWALRKGGPAAVSYRVFRETVRILAELKANRLPALFSWSSIPLTPICDDLSVLSRRERASYAYGAVHTVWLRCPQDAVLKNALRSMDRCGQLRVQNMATANTWIVGELDDELLMLEFGIQKSLD